MFVEPKSWRCTWRLLPILLSVLVWRPCGAVESSAWTAARATIVEDDLSRHVQVLASDTLEGREAGSRGGRAAGNYLVSQLQQLGLAGAGTGGGYVQAFNGSMRNVLAMLPGSDPTLREEVILLGAHYDHVGYGTARNSNGPIGYIHNGADDNASGTSGLLELAEAFTRLPQPPKRSILFAFWDGEEQGLLGSKHWVARPTISLRRVRACINLDMIGRLRDDRVEVYGTRTAAGLRRLVSQYNNGLRLDFLWDMEENSDHYCFFSRGIPTLMFHTGRHEDYHRPSDDLHKVNYAGARQVAQLVFDVCGALADAEEVPPFRPQSRRENETRRKVLERPLPPIAPRLGIQWRPADGQQGGVLVTRLTPRSPAQRAGLRLRDRILRFNDVEIADGRHLRDLILAAAGAARIVVARPDSDQPAELTVPLEGNPVRLGISWRQDSAEPDTLVVVRVVPGSPADRAGIKVGDRIYALSGKPITGSREFADRVTDHVGPVELSLERDGQVRTAKLRLGTTAQLAADPARN